MRVQYVLSCLSAFVLKSAAHCKAAGNHQPFAKVAADFALSIHSLTHSLPPASTHSHAPTGQGVNSALEDVCVLEQQVFDKSAGDLNQALPAFEQMRLPDSAALVKLVQVCFPLA